MMSLEMEFMAHWDAQRGVAPNLLLQVHVHRIREVLAFLEGEPLAAKPKAEIERIFRATNWLLDPGLFQEFVQVIGEVQFWAMARELGVELQRIPEQSKKTPDFRLAGAAGAAPCFEVKTLSVVDGVFNLGQIIENSYNAQLSLSEQVASGRVVATELTGVAPHGEVEDGKSMTTIICNLIKKADGNIKSGQYADAPTCLVLNLMLIDGYYNGNASLRPVAPGFPQKWNVRSGAYWSLAFGKPEQLVFGIPEFEGKPSVEGVLGMEGILHAHPEIQALLLVVHGLGREPTIFGLKRESEEDRWLDELESLSDAFFRLVGNNWNDDRDTMGWRLTND